MRREPELWSPVVRGSVPNDAPDPEIRAALATKFTKIKARLYVMLCEDPRGLR